MQNKSGERSATRRIGEGRGRKSETSTMTRYERLEDGYFKWLKSQFIIDAGPNHRTFDALFNRLYSKEFVWFVPNDDNRIGDGLELRREFMGGGRWPIEKGVSTLEVIVALSRRVAFNSLGTPVDWAWILLKNLK